MQGVVHVSWLSAFLDLPASSFVEGVAFWTGVTGYSVSEPRGEHREFVTLVPPDGDDFLRMQRVLDGPGGIHVDLHVADLRSSADEAVALGAEEVADRGHLVLRSPGGLVFCLVRHAGRTRPRPAEWPDGSRSIADQVVLDIPSDRFEEECAFWSALTGWELLGFDEFPEFRHLRRPDGMSMRVLLQRLGEATGPVRAHLDLAADDPAAEVRRHATLGAGVDQEFAHWTVLRDPAGATYCVTDRAPA